MASRRNTVSWTARLWDGMQELSRTPVRFAFHLAVARLITQWRSLLTIIAGTILSASIGALVPLYTTAIAQVGLTQRLDEQARRDVHVSQSIALRASDTIFYETAEPLGVAVTGADGAAQPLPGVRASLGYYHRWLDENTVALLEDGRYPDESPSGADDAEAVIGVDVANQLGVGVNTVLTLDPALGPSGERLEGVEAAPITVRIVGILSPRTQISFWNPGVQPVEGPDAGGWQSEFVFLVADDVFESVTQAHGLDVPLKLGLEFAADLATGLVKEAVQQDLGAINNWVDATATYGETGEVGILLPIEDSEEPQTLNGLRTRLAYYEGWEDYVQVVAGRLPQDTPENGEDMEVVIGLSVANEISSLAVDTVLVLDQRVKADGRLGTGYDSSVPITVRIVGIVAPREDEAAYWMERAGGSPPPLELNDRVVPWDFEFLCLTSRANFFRAATEYLPGPQTEIGWRVLFDHDSLPFSRITTARESLQLFERNMQFTFKESVSPSVGEIQMQRSAGDNLNWSYYTRLIDYDVIRKDLDQGILKEYADEVDLLDAPFGLLLLQVGALVLFFLMVTAALVRRGERREIAMLQSRGAWDSQILLLRGLEALMICVIAVVAAPFLSRALLTALGPYVADTDEFPLPMTANVFVFAGIAASVTFVALMFTLRPVLRQPLILAGGAASRSDKQHWWQRYYLDAVLALVGLGALWLLVRTGSPLADVNLGGQQADPLMLMAPALLFMALGSLALRFFPIMAAATARMASAGRNLLGALSGWQLSREPVHYGRITFLLALAIGIGWFATSFRATVSNSHEDQAKYKVGTDIRFTERDIALNANRARPADYYMAQDDILAASTTFRIENANLSTNAQDSFNGDILAIDPDTFGQTLYWRTDLGAIYTPRAPGDPPALPERGEPLPFAPAKVGVWARFDQVFSLDVDNNPLFRASVPRLVQRVDLYLRFLDDAGAWVVVPVEPVEIEYIRQGIDAPGLYTRSFVYSGWVYCEADLAALGYEPQGTLRLVSVFWEYRSPSRAGEGGMRITLADMSLFDSEGVSTPYDIFGRGDWDFLYDRGATIVGQQARRAWDLTDPSPRGDGLYLQWNQEDAPRTTVGVVLNYPDLGALDAVVSSELAARNRLEPGPDAQPFTLTEVARVRDVTFTPVQETEYYPSLYNRSATEGVGSDAFMIVDVRELLYRLNRRPSGTYYADEVWLRLAGGVDEQSISAATGVLDDLDDALGGSVLVIDSVTLAEELDKLQTDPLSLGLLGLMYLAFIIALVLSVVGLLTYAGLTAQARRMEFGVLRALGLSSLRVVGGLALEQLFVMAIGIVLGGALGAVLANQVVPTLALGAAGEDVIPPFVVRVGVDRLFEYALMMVVVLLLVLSSSLFLVRQLSLSRTLRLGDE